MAFYLLAPKVGDLVWAHVVMGVGIFCIVGGFVYVWQAFASRTWPSVKGIIKMSEMSTSSDHDGGRRYQFVVEYDYSVSGMAYTNNFYSYKPTYNAAQSRGARELVEKYPLESEVDVFYNPGNPKKSVLLPGFNFLCYMPILAGLIFCGFGIAMYLD